MEHIAVAEASMHRQIGPFRKGNEPPTFDQQHGHMRDAETLGTIKKEVLSSTGKNYVHSKVNASKKHSKKLTREVKVMMKQIACVMGEEEEGQESSNAGAASFEDIMNAAEKPLPLRVTEEDAIEWLDWVHVY